MFERDAQGRRSNVLAGVEAVVDKDLASGVLARELGADAFVMATDVPAVIDHWGMPSARQIAAARPEWLLAQGFPAGSMGPLAAFGAGAALAAAASVLLWVLVPRGAMRGGAAA